MDIPFEAHVLSAHRTPAEAAQVCKARGAGKRLRRADCRGRHGRAPGRGRIAANTTLPVIGVPVKGGAADGLDALLATVQMPSRHSGGHGGAERGQKCGCAGRADFGFGRARSIAARMVKDRARMARSMAEKAIAKKDEAAVQ